MPQIKVTNAKHELQGKVLMFLKSWYFSNLQKVVKFASFIKLQMKIEMPQ